MNPQTRQPGARPEGHSALEPEPFQKIQAPQLFSRRKARERVKTQPELTQLLLIKHSDLVFFTDE